jgi:hypothetical protein
VTTTNYATKTTSGSDEVTSASTEVTVVGPVSTSGLTDSELRATAVDVAVVSMTGGGLTDTELRATPVPVSDGGSSITVDGTFWQTTQPVSGTFWQATQPVSASSLPLPTGAATETTLSSVNTKTPALGQATMANSSPVVIASNQTAVPVSFSAASATHYYYNIASQVHVAAANTVHFDFFNADASLIVRVLSVIHIPDMVTAVATGVAFSWKLARTTAVGTGGTAQTAWLPDTTQTALDADITCRSKPTGGATESTILRNYGLHGEETNTGTIVAASLGGLELVPYDLRAVGKGIVLRQNQGLRAVQINSSALGNSGFLIGFTVE